MSLTGPGLAGSLIGVSGGGSGSVTFDAVKAALATADTLVDFNGQQLTGVMGIVSPNNNMMLDTSNDGWDIAVLGSTRFSFRDIAGSYYFICNASALSFNRVGAMVPTTTVTEVANGAIEISDGSSAVAIYSVAPTSSTSPGVAGALAWDAVYIYRHDGTQWTRAPLTYSTF